MLWLRGILNTPNEIPFSTISTTFCVLLVLNCPTHVCGLFLPVWNDRLYPRHTWHPDRGHDYWSSRTWGQRPHFMSFPVEIYLPGFLHFGKIHRVSWGQETTYLTGWQGQEEEEEHKLLGCWSVLKCESDSDISGLAPRTDPFLSLFGASKLEILAGAFNIICLGVHRITLSGSLYMNSWVLFCRVAS